MDKPNLLRPHNRTLYKSEKKDLTHTALHTQGTKEIKLILSKDLIY